jgi:hypothetical protein
MLHNNNQNQRHTPPRKRKQVTVITVPDAPLKPSTKRAAHRKRCTYRPNHTSVEQNMHCSLPFRADAVPQVLARQAFQHRAGEMPTQMKARVNREDLCFYFASVAEKEARLGRKKCPEGCTEPIRDRHFDNQWVVCYLLSKLKLHDPIGLWPSQPLSKVGKDLTMNVATKDYPVVPHPRVWCGVEATVCLSITQLTLMVSEGSRGQWVDVPKNLFSHLSELQSLCLCGHDFNDDPTVLDILAQAPQLRTIKFRNCRGLAGIVQRIPTSIAKLQFVNCVFARGAFQKPWSGLPNSCLRKLFIGFCIGDVPSKEWCSCLPSTLDEFHMCNTETHAHRDLCKLGRPAVDLEATPHVYRAMHSCMEIERVLSFLPAGIELFYGHSVAGLSFNEFEP